MKLFIWDLHGTLEQGNEHAVVEISNTILGRFGYSQRFTEEHVGQLYGLKWHQYFEFLLPAELADRHIELQAACFKFSNSPDGIKIIAKHMKPSRNALLVLEAIHKSKSHEQILISNTTPASLPVFINALKLQAYFTSSNSLAVNQHEREARRTKEHALAEYMKYRKYDGLVVIGDSESDMRLAEAVNARAYLYAHADVPFRSKRGDLKIHDLKKVLQEL